MKASGILSKMYSTQDSPVKYELGLSEERLNLTSLVGEALKITFSGKIYCSNCGNLTKKSYSQGHCFVCTMKLASCDLCIMKPETCHYSKGTCREPSWGEENCFKPHVIYLANSSGLKVGITRATNVPHRWIDQGASAALPILEVKDRFTSGRVEMLFKQFVADKTDWRKMLKGQPVEVNLKEWREKLLADLHDELQKLDVKLLDSEVWHFQYPVQQYPEKVSSYNLDKNPEIHDRLMGIKGQYLIFERGVLNVRSYSGYEVVIEKE